MTRLELSKRVFLFGRVYLQVALIITAIIPRMEILHERWSRYKPYKDPNRSFTRVFESL